MSKKKKSIPTVSTYEVVRKMRRDWGEINPVTRVEINKKFKKPKHIKKEWDKHFEE